MFHILHQQNSVLSFSSLSQYMLSVCIFSLVIYDNLSISPTNTLIYMYTLHVYVNIVGVLHILLRAKMQDAMDSPCISNATMLCLTFTFH